MSTSDLQDLDSIDLADPTVWDDGPPYELFARMQREAPVHFSPQNNAPGKAASGRSPGSTTSAPSAGTTKPSPRNAAAFSTSTTWVSRWIFSGCS